ncbi:hypothetical protein SNEBB_005377 [Seison nebaliae]|nr:hypothetical protein SNEBB_005377 [Seison nebaliae]
MVSDPIYLAVDPTGESNGKLIINDVNGKEHEISVKCSFQISKLAQSGVIYNDEINQNKIMITNDELAENRISSIFCDEEVTAFPEFECKRAKHENVSEEVDEKEIVERASSVTPRKSSHDLPSPQYLWPADETTSPTMKTLDTTSSSSSSSSASSSSSSWSNGNIEPIKENKNDIERINKNKIDSTLFTGKRKLTNLSQTLIFNNHISEDSGDTSGTSDAEELEPLNFSIISMFNKNLLAEQTKRKELEKRLEVIIKTPLKIIGDRSENLKNNFKIISEIFSKLKIPKNLSINQVNFPKKIGKKLKRSGICTIKQLANNLVEANYSQHLLRAILLYKTPITLVEIAQVLKIVDTFFIDYIRKHSIEQDIRSSCNKFENQLELSLKGKLLKESL